MRDSRNINEDFSTWAALARQDPRAFEALRQSKVQDLIERAPRRRRQRLEALQWRIDQERNRAATPLDACRRLSGMMWDSVLGKGGLLESLRAPRSASEGARHPRPAQGGSNVLRFRPRR
jgi:hypothetical protein